MRELVTLPSELLRMKSEPVKRIDSEIKALASDMAEFMCLHPSKGLKPVGLAAPQMGELVRVLAFYPSLQSEDKDIQVLINPELVYEKGSRWVDESCLSIPGRTFVLKRAKIVKIRGLTLAGVTRTFRGRELLAQIFQHEINHLDGILIDQLGKEKGVE